MLRSRTFSSEICSDETSKIRILGIKVRFLSLLIRRLKSRQECRRIVLNFEQWRILQGQLPEPRTVKNTVLIVRLDDIGDYLLFRNQLSNYKRSARWGHQSITLLGNDSWREFFSTFDGESVDDTIWVNKNEYLSSPDYRLDTWTRLRARGFETVIAPSRTRPLLLDDLCRLAAAPTCAIGSVNTYVHPVWNQRSDGCYDELFFPLDSMVHEFDFNAQFSAWITGFQYAGTRPTLELPDAPTIGSHIVCFIGANTRSRRWPVARWIELILGFRRRHSGDVILAGHSPAERRIAADIQARTDAQSIVGTVSLMELLAIVASARAVLTNDTMAAHLSIACGRPTVIIANGVNYHRFTDYAMQGARVTTLYPKVFERKRKRLRKFIYHYTDALTSDIASIDSRKVLAELERLLGAERPLSAA